MRLGSREHRQALIAAEAQEKLAAEAQEQRWAEAARESASVLRVRRGEDGLWRQDDDYRGLGTLHGAAGNTLALLRLEPDEALARETATVLARHAFREDGLANWPGSPRPQLARPRDGRICLQWCTGAPGILAGAWDYLSKPVRNHELATVISRLVGRPAEAKVRGSHGLGAAVAPAACHSQWPSTQVDPQLWWTQCPGIQTAATWGFST